MTPVDTSLTTRNLTAPGCFPLPVVSDGIATASFWKPTPEELAALNAGGLVWLSVLGSSQPPVKLEVMLPEFVREIGTKNETAA